MTKLKRDENLPAFLTGALTEPGHDADSVVTEGLASRPDSDVWEASQAVERFLTEDLDFSDVRRFQPGSHHGILLVRWHHPSRKRLANRVRQVFESEDVASRTGCFVTATEHPIRLRRTTA